MVLGGLRLEHCGGLHLAQPLRLGVSVNVLRHGLGGREGRGGGEVCVCVCVYVCVAET